MKKIKLTKSMAKVVNDLSVDKVNRIRVARTIYVSDTSPRKVTQIRVLRRGCLSYDIHPATFAALRRKRLLRKDRRFSRGSHDVCYFLSVFGHKVVCSRENDGV